MTVPENVDLAHLPIVSPKMLAHIVLRTSRFDEVVQWYKNTLGAHASFENDSLAFLTYDSEHHRIAVLSVPGLSPQPDGTAGVHHVAFTYATLYDLLSTFTRLKSGGDVPILSINHGPTTSLYYSDPDGNQVELQVDNFDTEEDAKTFFASGEFATNPVGVDFDPEELFKRLLAGETEAKLKARPVIGARHPSSVPLR